MSKEKLLIIDGHSMAFRAFYALPPENFTTTTGQATNAVYGFTTMTLRMIEEHAPTHIAVAFDTKVKSFRSDEYPEYKAGRAETPQEFKGQISLIKQVLETMGVTWITKDGFEADDILATLAKAGDAAGMQVLVASGDRDSFQMITQNVHVIYPGRTPADLKIMDAAAVEARYGVPPHWYPHIAALSGEKADNLPGVPGVGEKTAAQWVMKYQGLEGVLENADKITGKRGEALREHKDDVLRNRRLNQLLTDVELPYTVQQLTRQKVKRAAVNELFDALEFNRLRARVFKLDGGEVEDSEGVNPADSTIPQACEYTLQTSGFTQWVQQVPDTARLAVAAEYVGAELDALALYYLAEGGLSEPGDESAAVSAAKPSVQVYAVEMRDLGAAEQTALEELLRTHFYVTHEGKKLRHSAATVGLNLPQPEGDTELAAYLLAPDQREYSLASLAEKLLQRVLTVPEGLQLSLLRDFKALADTAQVIYDLHTVLVQRLKETQLFNLYEDLELPVQNNLYQLEATGVAMSMEVLNQLLAELTQQVDAAEEAAFNAIGHKVNLASPMQLQTVLFEELQMPKTKKTKRGYTTNAEALADLYAKTQHPFLRHLLAHRDKIKMRQIVEGLISAVAADGRIHTTFQQTVAATGRLSSTEPNLQNIPARSAEGVRIRGAFVPGPGFDYLMTVDYSQIEMRLMAHMSGDDSLINAFKSGEDLHRTMAAMVFDVPVSEVTPQLRSQIKATSYGLAYGLSSYGLSQQLGISVSEASRLKEQYFERFGAVGRYLGTVVEEAREAGFTQTLMGRRRYLPDLNSANANLRAMAERAALNAPIQGSAADIIKLAMHLIMREFSERNLVSRVLLQVHDELVLEVVASELDVVRQIVTEVMGSAVDLSVPLDVSVGVGQSWEAAAH